MWKRGLFLLMAVVFEFALTSQAFAAKSSGDGCDRQADGTKKRPYVICSAEDLQLLHAYPSAHFILGKDIHMQNEPWTAVPAFSGSLDGQQHAIANLSGYEGLFHQIERSGVVKNLKLQQVNISGAMLDAGSVASYNHGKIERVEVTGHVSASYSAGGLAGINYGLIQHSVMNGSVTSGYSTGGIASMNAAGGKIEHAKSHADISGSYDSGGIAGMNEGIIHHATVRGSVTGYAAGAGGIVSSNTATGVLRHAKSHADIYYMPSIAYGYGQIYGYNDGNVSHCQGTGQLIALTF